MNNKEKGVNPADRKGTQHPKSTTDREHSDIKKMNKNQGIPNSGGQYSFQTDNKQGNVNRGNQNPDRQGKKN
ncbi:hypothetical protein [Albibacterium bauzanense]|uniref:Uncharacterized protein n=1 Tax=Albibacterium bauzanense TaxID=653929 RepID=A0A4R1LKW1_9SPHI|nr:hypothetical protein [Albibacterium bauzanense]TCK79526.1 hypothetical protein C8N28_2757 [Albibacterium bauzanense]